GVTRVFNGSLRSGGGTRSREVYKGGGCGCHGAILALGHEMTRTFDATWRGLWKQNSSRENDGVLYTQLKISGDGKTEGRYDDIEVGRGIVSMFHDGFVRLNSAKALGSSRWGMRQEHGTLRNASWTCCWAQ
ncbi:hypothetical protein Tco_1286450, partial [Tanacetum coccineum]